MFIPVISENISLPEINAIWILNTMMSCRYITTIILK